MAGSIFIDQSQYIKSILTCYGMANCTPVSTPLSAKANFDPAPSEEHSMVSSYPYLEVIGSLMYAALGMRCRQDISLMHKSPIRTGFDPPDIPHLLRVQNPAIKVLF